MRTQIMLAARLPNSDEFISDAALFAWSHTRSMIENLGEFTYYELEQEFGGSTWGRSTLVAACRYMFLRDLESSFRGNFKTLLCDLRTDSGTEKAAPPAPPGSRSAFQ